MPRQLAQLTLASTMLSLISFRRLAAASNSGFSLCSSKLVLLKHANAQADFLWTEAAAVSPDSVHTRVL